MVELDGYAVLGVLAQSEDRWVLRIRESADGFGTAAPTDRHISRTIRAVIQGGRGCVPIGRYC